MTLESFLKIGRTLKLLADGPGLTFDELTESLGCKRSSTYDWINRMDEMLDGALLRPESPQVGRYKVRPDAVTDLAAPVILDWWESVVVSAILPYSPLILPPSFLSVLEGVKQKLSRGKFHGDRLFVVSAAKRPQLLTWAGPEADVMMENLFSAAEDHLECRVDYTNRSGQEKTFDIRPLAFVEKEGRAYLLYANTWNNEVHSLRPEAIRSVEVLNDRNFSPPDGFDPQDFIESSFGTFFGDEFTFCVRFTPKVTPNISVLKLAKKQKMTPEPDGSLVVEVTCHGQESVLQWLLGFGA